MKDQDLDEALIRLAQAPIPPGLDETETRVLVRIAARPVARAGMGIGAMMIAAALVLGVYGARVPASQTEAAPLLSPLGPVTPLAPSTLLVGVP